MKPSLALNSLLSSVAWKSGPPSQPPECWAMGSTFTPSLALTVLCVYSIFVVLGFFWLACEKSWKLTNQQYLCSDDFTGPASHTDWFAHTAVAEHSDMLTWLDWLRQFAQAQFSLVLIWCCCGSMSLSQQVAPLYLGTSVHLGSDPSDRYHGDGTLTCHYSEVCTLFKNCFRVSGTFSGTPKCH